MTPHPIDRFGGKRGVIVIRPLTLSFLLLTATAVSAQQSASPSYSQEIVVTASGISESRETTPSAVTVISREEIERRAARDVAEVLREVPGVTVARTGSPGKVSSVFIRGGNSQHALVLWNGMEINNPFFSGYDWGRFSTAGVERVEVVPGPYSALYGSDAVSGVINILTSTDRTFLTADVAGGENGLFNGALSGALSRGALSANASIESRTDDGFEPNDDFQQESALGGFRWKISPTASGGIQARYTSYDLGVPRNVSSDGTSFIPTPERRQEGSEFQLLAPFSFRAGGIDFEARLSRSDRDDLYSDPEDAFGITWSRTESTTDRAQLSARRPTRSGTWTVGSEYENANVDDRTVFGANLDARGRESVSFFAEDRLTVALRGGASLEIAAGARYDDFDSFGSELSPRIAAAVHRGPHKIRGAYGQAFRAPSIGELYYPYFGNPALKAEHGRSAEVGYDGFFRRVTFTATLFRADYDDLIVYDNVRNAFGNVGAAKTRGIEVGLSGHVIGGWSAAGSYTYLDTEQESTGETLLRRPRHSGTLSVGYDRGPFRALLVGLRNGSRADVTDLYPYSRVTNAAYTTADLTVDYDLGAFTPYVKVENVTDENYEEVFGYPSPGRRLLAGLRYSLGR